MAGVVWSGPFFFLFQLKTSSIDHHLFDIFRNVEGFKILVIDINKEITIMFGWTEFDLTRSNIYAEIELPSLLSRSRHIIKQIQILGHLDAM